MSSEELIHEPACRLPGDADSLPEQAVGLPDTDRTQQARPASPVAPEPVFPADEASEPASVLALTAGDCRFLLGACTIIVLLMTFHLVRPAWQHPAGLTLLRPEERQFDYQIDINQAGWVEWMQLPGIGETTARTIVADRQNRGPFEQIEDVQRVRGIGPATFSKIRPYLKETAADASKAELMREQN